MQFGKEQIAERQVRRGPCQSFSKEVPSPRMKKKSPHAVHKVVNPGALTFQCLTWQASPSIREFSTYHRFLRRHAYVYRLSSCCPRYANCFPVVDVKSDSILHFDMEIQFMQQSASRKLE